MHNQVRGYRDGKGQVGDLRSHNEIRFKWRCAPWQVSGSSADKMRSTNIYMK